ncbi:DUF6029 family protein [Flavobacterium silvaticum]|uniref:Uncharacterized protein n=1 Tax=Flavobacterium silvaticum TaxID=1852020 RepID=A0A972JJZ3_9FLAO|nr:DUF6029 family protein [Flavobacterium silvaticum]NMH28602.1 hypothetical protein [Flavobacterium silvaticum]
MKHFILALGCLTAVSVFAQETTTEEKTKKDYGKVFGSFESNAQWYLNDEGRGLMHPEDPIRSNNYLLVNYQYKGFTAGIQMEGYEGNALLNYNPGYKGINLGTAFVNYKSKYIEVTAGHFYEQFGSGIIFRAWEDRALGINTAVLGGKVIVRPVEDLRVTFIGGKQRSGFKLSDGFLAGSDLDWNLSNLLKFEESDLSFGASYIQRYEKLDIPVSDPDFNETTRAYSGRVNFSHSSFYASAEYDYKSKDVVLNAQNQINPDFVKPGNAVLVNFGYSRKGLGVDATLRRVENMLFLSERTPTPVGDGVSTSLNFNDKFISYIPALTKQHHSNLANIYVYQAQAKVDFIDPTILKAGETGGQIDFFYQFDKGTALGGKYGTKVSANFAQWYNLPGTYRQNPAYYDTEFFGVGEKYFSDLNFEIDKKFSDKWHTAFYFVRQFYNKKWLEGGDAVRTHIVDAEVTYNFTSSRSLRIEAEHMWADADKKNWASATAEFSLNNHLSFYVWDMYNYGNDDENFQTHYYNVGGAYRFKSTRIAMNYGRQRGGLVCVGGVCRFVPESTGVSLSVSTAF